MFATSFNIWNADIVWLWFDFIDRNLDPKWMTKNIEAYVFKPEEFKCKSCVDLLVYSLKLNFTKMKLRLECVIMCKLMHIAASISTKCFDQQNRFQSQKKNSDKIDYNFKLFQISSGLNDENSISFEPVHIIWIIFSVDTRCCASNDISSTVLWPATVTQLLSQTRVAVPISRQYM